MSRQSVPSAEAYAAAIERAERAEQLAAQRLDALAAVREAIGIPHAATVGEDATVRTPILLHRVRHLSVFLDYALADDGYGGLPWSVAYLRERLAEQPADGYKTWGQAVAELHGTCRCGQPKPEDNDRCPACEEAEGRAAVAALREAAEGGER